MDEPATIDVFSDVVCPWCYIGKRRLEAALEDHEGPPPVVRWHAFQLNPDIPEGGVDRRAYFAEKFGGGARVRDILARVEAVGREVGIDFEFERIERQPNTLDAHRLIAWAQAEDPGAGTAVVEALFRAYFIEGHDIGEREVLATLAEDCGLEREAAAAFLASEQARAEIAASNREARRIGIEGVPFFVFERRMGVSGAQPAEVLREAMAEAARAVAAELTPPAG